MICENGSVERNFLYCYNVGNGSSFFHCQEQEQEEKDMTIGEVIREKRKELELTQEQVAQRLGV